MKFSVAAVVLAAASLVYAEEHNVIVGKDKDGKAALVFTPDQVKAKVGDRINFQFYPKNHTVTQSSFAEPCTRQRNTVTNELGVDSDFMPVAADAKEIPVWTVEIMQDTAPIWMFCNQGNHCNSGMVFAVNAPAEGEKSFDTWKAKVKDAKHPPPEDKVTADFTPPAAPSGATPPPADASASASASASGSAAPSGSAPAPSNAPSGATPTSGAPTPPASQDQANAPSDSPAATTGGALAAFNVPGAGVALSLAGLVAGLLL